MALDGTIIKLPNGEYAFEYVSTEFNRPKQARHVWVICNWWPTGMGWAEADDTIGKRASINDGEVSCYLGNGKWFKGRLPEGGSTRAISIDVTDVPPPRTKLETRWHNGRWEKYLKASGWRPA